MMIACPVSCRNTDICGDIFPPEPAPTPVAKKANWPACIDKDGVF